MSRTDEIETILRHDDQFAEFSKRYLGTTDPDLMTQELYGSNGTEIISKMNPVGSGMRTLKSTGRSRKMRNAPLSTPTSQSVPTPKVPVAKPKKAPPKQSSSTSSSTVTPSKPSVAKSFKSGLASTGKKIALPTVLVGSAAAGYAGRKYVKKKKAQLNQDHGFVELEKSDYEYECEFSKVDNDKRQVFGWASIVTVGGKPVVDRQGDTIDVDEMEKSAYEYVLKSRRGSLEHRRDQDQPFAASDLIESFVVTDDKRKHMFLGEDVPTGWWVGFKVRDEETWQQVKNGDVTGFSVHGKGKRKHLLNVEMSQDDVRVSN